MIVERRLTAHIDWPLIAAVLAAVGSSTGGVWFGCGSARSMFVPSAVSLSSSAAWLEAGMPVTTIIVAKAMRFDGGRGRRG